MKQLMSVSSRPARTNNSLDIFMPSVVAPPAELYSSDRNFAYRSIDQRYNRTVSNLLYGLSKPSQESEDLVEKLHSQHPFINPAGLLDGLPRASLPTSHMKVPQLHKLILDSGKLAKLDQLLPELKAGGHRCLVYFQMTRMIDLMEEYLSFRQYK